MQLRFLGKNSTVGDCPTLYSTDRDTYLVQGWKIFANDLLMQLDIPEGHTAVEVPTELFKFLKEDGLTAGEFRRLEDPIMVLTPRPCFRSRCSVGVAVRGSRGRPSRWSGRGRCR
ncbi:hypothetical protein ABT212_48135, partial [Streptomyces sp. NPDC001652]